MVSYGRGGAGNFQAVQQANAQISADLEANQAAAGSLQSDYLAERQQRQYAYSGRGGIGNVYSTNELKETAPASEVETTTQGSEETTRTAGRGGAGNYEYAANDNKGKAEREHTEEARSRQKLKQDIERCVEEQLAMPQKAKLPSGEP